jgi:hypothetical protein
VSATPNVMFAAKVTCQYQKPPHVRPAGHAVLLLRVPARTDPATKERPARDTWRLARLGEFAHGAGELKDWTGDTLVAQLEVPFTPPDIPARDMQWMTIDLAASCLPHNFEPGVLPALERFARDQALDSILARADAATTHAKGDDDMSTEIAALKRDLADLQRRVGPPTGNPEEFRQAQLRADSVYHLISDSGAPAALAGERILEYRARLLAGVQHLARQFKTVNFSLIGDPVAMGAIESRVYADAATECLHPTGGFLPGQLRAIKTRDPSGREITKYVGHQGACWDQFNQGVRYVRRLLTAGAR